MDRESLRSHLNFETLAKFFFDLAEERYPSAEKIKQMASQLINPLAEEGSIENVHLKIAALSVMRNMIREVSPGQLYRSIQHRDELYAALIEALEDLEDELDELHEQLEEKEND